MTRAASDTAASKTPIAFSSSHSARRATDTLVGALGRCTTLAVLTSQRTCPGPRPDEIPTPRSVRCPGRPSGKPDCNEVVITWRARPQARHRSLARGDWQKKGLGIAERSLAAAWFIELLFLSRATPPR